MNTLDWILDNRVSPSVKTANVNPHMLDMPVGSRHWEATFSTSRSCLIVFYSTGPNLTSWSNPLYGREFSKWPDDSNPRPEWVGNWTEGPKRIKFPPATEILSCLADDFSMAEGYSDGIDLAVGLGQTLKSEEDVENARATWRTIQTQRKGLEAVVSPEAVSTLIYDIERE